MATQQELLIKIRGDIADIQSKLNKHEIDEYILFNKLYFLT